MGTTNSDLDLTIEDFNAAFRQLADECTKQNSARSTDNIRRILRTTLACLYEIRAYREGEGSAERKGYHDRILRSETTGGGVTEGIAWARGKMVHRLVHGLTPEHRPLYPREDLYPSNHLSPGENLTWLLPDAIGAFSGVGSGAQRRHHYEVYVAGKEVLPSLDVALRYLVNDPGPTP